MLKVSVVITTYKRDTKFLEEAINSVKKQTYKPIEIILVDDNGSGSEYQLKNKQLFSKDEFINYIANEKNSGAQYSRNVGINAAKGEFIAFLDDDDFWDERKIEKQISVFTSDDIGMSFTQGWIFDDGHLENKRIYPSSAKFVKEPSFNTLLEKDVIGTTTQALIKKSCFDTVGNFDLNMPARQDYEMWLRISSKYRIIGVEECLFYHRMHKSEQISKSYKKALDGYKRILEKYQKSFKNNPHAKSYKYYKMGLTCFQAGHKMEAIVYYWKAFITSPGYIIKNAIHI